MSTFAGEEFAKSCILLLGQKSGDLDWISLVATFYP